MKISKFITTGATIGTLFFSQEAHVSEVFYEDSKESLEQLSTFATHIVVAKPLGGSAKILREVVFPKSTHHSKSEESKYQDLVDGFEVLEVLKSTSIAKGPISVFHVPEYNEGAMRAYHELNQTESPIVRQYRSKNEPSGGEKQILFLVDYRMRGDEKIKTGVYTFRGAEGMKSETEVRKILVALAPKGPAQTPAAKSGR